MNTRRPLLFLSSRAVVVSGFVYLGLLGLLGGLAGVAASACATDNGDNTYGPDYGPLPKSDGAADADDVSEDGPTDPDDAGDEEDAPAACTSGTTAVLAGNDGALTAAVQEKNGAWVTSTIAGGAAKSKPALVAFGAGFLGATHGAADALQSTTYDGAGWSGASAFGNAGVKGAPTLAVAGTKAHVVYSAGTGANRDFAHGVHDGTSWNAATAQVGPPPSFGTVSAGLAAAGSEVVMAENGSDNGLYVRSFDGSWSASSGIVGAGTLGSTIPATPEIVAVDGAFDLLLVYVEKDTYRIASATRDAASKAWVDRDPIQDAATTEEKLSLARISPSTVLLTFRGQDDNGYYAQATIGAGTVTWSAPQPIGGAGPFAVDSTPAVAKGVCGDDAVVAYATGGVVRVTRLRAGTWTSPEAVGTASGTRVAIATK